MQSRNIDNYCIHRKDEGRTCKELAGSRTEIVHALENPPPLINIDEEFGKILHLNLVIQISRG
jgi:hypothetical protein